ncbi:MAG: 6-phosphogluconolactonase, partial [Mycobacterium sp.]|nr:6-phosphogluconolactonase [Mycobacterium sp.]
MSVIVETYPDTRALVAAAGDRLVQAIATAIASRGQAQVVLTGGGTGIGLLKHVGAHDDAIDWS